MASSNTAVNFPTLISNGTVPPIGTSGTVCTDDIIKNVPSVDEFFHVLGVSGWLILGFGSVALITITVLFVANIIHVIRNVHPRYKLSTSIVLSNYPAIGLCMYLQMLFPRANFILDSSAHLWFVFCMFHFFRLTISYFGGETSFVRSLEGSVLPWRGVPCCFWPCVWPCLPKGPVTKNQVRLLRVLILQHPFVQAIFTIIGFTLYVEDLYEPALRGSALNPFLYIYLLTTVSFFFALWAFIVSFKSSRQCLRGFKYCGKIASFQLSLIFFRLQSIVFSLVLLPAGVFPCLPPVSPKVMANLILCSLVLGQLVVLSVLANHFYRISEADRRDYIPKSARNIEFGGRFDKISI